MKKIGILVKKEMTEILRDKKTLIIMVLMPLLLYPSLLIGISLGATMLMESQEEKEHIVGYFAEDAVHMEQIMSLYEQEEIDTELTFREVQAREEADVLVSFSEKEQGIEVQVDYTSTNQESSYAEASIEDLVELLREEMLIQNLKAEGLSEEFLHPVTYKATDSVSTSESMGMSIGGSIGMLLITTILMGAFYPAVDVTTGEKERGTLETLLTLPVTNFQMIMSKFISVSIFACVTAILSLLALGGSVLFLMYALPDDGAIQMPIEAFVGSVPILLLALITTALLITAFCMCFCVFAKSTKEANNYMQPIMLVIMFACMLGMMPTVELDYKFALIPFINASLLIKQVLAQQLDMYLALITTLVNLGYSVIIIWVLAKMYDSEDIMFSDGFRSFRLFQKRSDIKKGTVPATGDVIICLVVVFLLMTYIGGVVSIRDVFVGTIVTQLLILATPLLLTWYMKSDKKELFSLKVPRLSLLQGSVLLYIGAFLLELVAVQFLCELFPQSAQNVAVSFDEIISHSFPAVVFAIAVMPAIGEELLFRGMTFGSLHNTYKAVWAILVSSLIFGAFHGSLVKLLPTAMLGVCFAYIIYKGGSIYITMGLHFLNNFISVVSMKKPEIIENLLPILVKEELSGIEMTVMVIIGVVSVTTGFLLINRKEIVKTENKVLTE